MRSKGHCKTICVGMSLGLANLGLLSGLAGCGGSSVPTSTPVPVSSQAPAPTPPSPPPAGPSTSVDFTQEGKDTAGLAAINASAAYALGWTGKGVTLAVLDTGLNPNTTEFTGRIDPASKDFTTGGAILDSYLETDGKTYPYGHGTAVANVVAAAKNGLGIYGVAYEATIFAARIYGGEIPLAGTETQAQLLQDGVNFNNNFSDAVITARAAGARAVNLSLGNSGINPTPSDPKNTTPLDYTAYDASNVRFNTELQNTFDNGTIIVNSAGNDHSYTGTGANRKEKTDSNGNVLGVSPNSFPQYLVGFSKSGSATIRDIPLLIVGAVDANNVITDYSDRAGTGVAANYYIVAPGNVVAPFDNGALYNVQGTSFSAPLVTGAIGLLAQAFPMLTGQNITDLLLGTATHLGTTPVGTLDPIYGHGLLNIQAAFQPQGSASVQTSSGTVNIALSNLSLGLAGQLGSAFGDAATLRTALAATVYLDSYKRPYTANLAGPVANINRPIGLAGFAATTTRQISSNGHVKGIHFNLSAERNDPLPTSFNGNGIATSTRPLSNIQFDTGYAINTNLALTFASGSGDSRVLGLSTDASRDLLSGYDDRLLNIGSPTQKFGFGLNAHLGKIEMLTGWSYAKDNGRSQTGFAVSPVRLNKLAVHFRRPWTAGLIEAGVTLQHEQGSVLGSRPTNGLAFGTGTQGVIGRLGGSFTHGPWTVAATGHFGRIAISGEPGGIVNKTDALLVSAFAASARYALPQHYGDLVMGISQPLRVESGVAHIQVPTRYDYSVFQVVSSASAAALSPSGREMDLEFGYTKSMAGYGNLQLNTFDRLNAGHSTASSNDKGILLRWKSMF